MKKRLLYASLIINALLILVHFVLKDRIFPLAIIFYAFPLILIIGISFVNSLLFYKIKSLFLILLLTTIVLFSVWIQKNYNFKSTEVTLNKGETVLFWNVAKKAKFPLDILIKNMASQRVDILCIVEARHLNTQDLKILQAKFPQFVFQELNHDMLIGIRGQIDAVNYVIEAKSYAFNHIEANLDNKNISVLIADVYASPFYNKETALTYILNYAEKHHIELITGDFNTPYESVHFDSYATNYSSFHNYSEGCSATWPFGIPLLELDQIWLSKKKQPKFMTLEQYYESDHKLLIANYE